MIYFLAPGADRGDVPTASWRNPGEQPRCIDFDITASVTVDQQDRALTARPECARRPDLIPQRRH
jgi:hypothetical protein